MINQLETKFGHLKGGLRGVGTAMAPFVSFLSKIGEYCENQVSFIIADVVCSFPDWTADKLFAPIAEVRA